MDTVIDFKAASSPDGLLNELIKVSEHAEFGWFKTGVGVSLDQYVLDSLATSVDKSRYSPLPVEDNIREAASILNDTIDLRSQVLDLEAQAIQSVLDLQLAQQVARYDTVIAKMGFTAASAQAGQVDADLSIIDRRAELINDARASQVSLHRRSGSALNYGERVKFLRAIYLDNVVMAYERAWAIWLGVEASYSIDLGTPPVWSSSSESLFSLVKWVRLAVRSIKERTRNERVLDQYYSVRSLSQGGGDAFQQKLDSGEETSFDFSLTYLNVLGLKKDEAVRIVGLSATIVFENDCAQLIDAFNKADDNSKRVFEFSLEQVKQYRREIGFTFSIKLPDQLSRLAAASETIRTWTIDPVVLTGQAAWAEQPPQASMRMYRGSQFVNANPMGDWHVVLGSIAQVPGGTVTPGKLPKRFTLPPALERLLKPVDIIVGLQLAVVRHGEVS